MFRYILRMIFGCMSYLILKVLCFPYVQPQFLKLIHAIVFCLRKEDYFYIYFWITLFFLQVTKSLVSFFQNARVTPSAQLAPPASLSRGSVDATPTWWGGTVPGVPRATSESLAGLGADRATAMVGAAKGGSVTRLRGSVSAPLEWGERGAKSACLDFGAFQRTDASVSEHFELFVLKANAFCFTYYWSYKKVLMKVSTKQLLYE